MPKPRPVRAKRAAPRTPLAPRTEGFVPLFAGAPLLPSDRGQVVRIAIPRAALAPAGFPVDPVRLHDRIRADVLMGEDGVIRGIRFVR
jgi:hypothetical protein